KFGEAPESMIYTPLIIQDKCIGVLTVQSFSKNAYSRSDVSLVESLSAFVASALSNAKLLNNIKLIAKLGKEVTATLDVIEIADKLYHGLSELLDTSIFILSEFSSITKEVSYLRFYENGELLGEGKGHNIDEIESFSVWCIQNKKPILIGSQEDFKKYLKKPLTDIGDLPQSLICLPLIYEDDCLGVLTVQSFEQNAYSPSQVDLLMTISSSLAVAMNNAKIHSNIEEITELGAEITGMTSIREISVLMHDKLQRVMPFEGFGIGSYNALVQGLEFDDYIENGTFLDHHIDPIDSNRISAISFNSERTIHTSSESDFKEFVSESYVVEHGVDTLSIIYVPLLYSNKCLGVITVQSEPENQFSKGDVQLLESLAPYVAVAIDNITSFNNLTILSEIGHEISSTLDMEKIAEELYKRLSNLLDAFTFLLATYNTSKGLIEYIRVYEDGEKIADGVSYSVDERETLATVTVRDKEVIHLSNHEEKFKYIKTYKTHDGAPHESIIYLPIIFQNEVIGIFSVQSQKKNAYNKYHVEVMKTLGSYLSIAFNNSLSHSELRIINELGQEITAQTDPIDVLYTAYDKLSEVIDLDGFGIGVHNPITNALDFPGFIEDGEMLSGGSQDLNTMMPGTICFIEQKLVHINSLDELDAYKDDKALRPVDGRVCKSVIYVPITLGKERLGVATMQCFVENGFSDKHAKLFKNLCAYIAVALDNWKSYENLSTLSEIGKTITSTFDMKLIAKTLMESLTTLMDLESFIFGTYNLRTNGAKIIGLYELGNIIAEDWEFEMDASVPLCNYVVENKKPINTGTVDELLKLVPSFVHDPKNGEPTKSILYLPIVFNDEVLGFVSVQNTKENAFSDRHLEVLNNISSYLAVAINNNRSYETTNRIGQIGQEITATLELSEIFNTIFQNLNSMMFVEFLVIAEYNKETKQIIDRYRIEHGEVFDTLNTANVDNDNHPGAWCVRNKKSIHINDLLKEYQIFSKDLGDTSKQLPMSVIYKPLMSGEDVIGLISIQSYEKFAYNEYHVQILDLIAPYVTSAIQNGLTYEKLGQANEELEKLSIVASETDNAIVIANAQGEYEWMNDAYSKLTGLTMENLKTAENKSIQSASTYDGVEKAISIVKSSKESVQYESYMEVEGSKRWMQTTLTPILDIDGNLRKLVAIDSEITEIKKAQDALIRSEEDYKRLFEQISDSIFITDKATGKFIDCNNAVLHIYGYSKEEVLSKSSIDFHPEDEIIVGSDGERKIDFNVDEFHHVKSNGEKIIVDISSVDIYYKGYDATLSIIRDITVTKRFEQKILDQNAELEKLSIVASNTDNVVIICAPNGDLLWANESFEKLYDLTLDDWIIENEGNLIGGSGNKNAGEYINRCVSTKEGVSYESKYIKKDGTVVWLQSTLTPVFDEADKLKNLVIIDSDITTQKENELLVIEKNNDITDSINYASRLQKAILPDQSDFNQMMDGAFVYFEPRDIVSGDFYWMTRTEDDALIVAAIDCTGHGVPGAFLTITGNDLLNQIVKMHGITDPAEILEKMNEGLLRRLHSTKETQVRDGMDMSVCKIGSKKGDIFEIEYAGAFNPLYYVVNKEINEVRANRFAIGTILEEGQAFESEKLKLPKDAMLYLFSDGYHDQLGGKKGKKFMKSKFRQLLVEISDLHVDEQFDKLKSNFEDWSGELAQIDDVLVMGIRL
ncbi:MAG: PAS domain S-box-containing protein, partial [Parvicellaceae bacterium]